LIEERLLRCLTLDDYSESANLNYEPKVLFFVFDPSTPMTIPDLVRGCGDPTPYLGYIEVAQSGLRMNLGLNAFHMKDSINATWESANTSSVDDSCSVGLLSRTDYAYYTGDLQVFNTRTLDSNPDHICGYPGTPGQTNYCWMVFGVTMKSTLITTQTSARGTNTLDILLAESAILGGVMFFTWFCSVFMLTDAERENKATQDSM
jgi:hypothetical protein